MCRDSRLGGLCPLVRGRSYGDRYSCLTSNEARLAFLTLPANRTRQASSLPSPTPAPQTRHRRAIGSFLVVRQGQIRFEENVQFFFGGGKAFGKRAAVVFRHAVLPLEEVSDALRLDAHFDAAQAGEQ